MMRKIYYSLAIIIIIISACKSGVKNKCEFSGMVNFSFLNNLVSMEVPSELLTNKDTVNHDFEMNRRSLYVCELSTKDSSNYIFVQADSYDDYSPISKDVENNLNRLRNVQMSIVKYDNGYLFERYDTVNGKMIGEFIFEGKQINNDVVTGGITFYHNKKRIEIVVLLKNKNFTDTRERVRCILSSVKPPNDKIIVKPGTAGLYYY